MTTSPSAASPWREVEIRLTAEASHVAPYDAVEVWADFSCGEEVLRRPAFWDGGDRWSLRFAAPHTGDWRWRSRANVDDPGLDGRTGTVVCADGGAEPGGPTARMSGWTVISSTALNPLACRSRAYAWTCSGVARQGRAHAVSATIRAGVPSACTS